jgi:hypothetical protein
MKPVMWLGKKMLRCSFCGYLANIQEEKQQVKNEAKPDKK